MKNRLFSGFVGKAFIIALSVVILASIFPACTIPGQTVTPPPGTTPASPATSPSPSVTAKPTPSVTPRPPTSGQGTLTLTDSGPITLDPATTAEVTSAAYIIQIFGGLLRLDENLNVVPDIAGSWDKSTDGRTFTFHLRPDARFHDGKTVKAGDFKYSWERALNPATNSLTAGTYLNDIVGAGDILSGKSKTLSGVRVVDDFTLEVKIDGPKAYFLMKMAYPTAFVVDRANVESGGQWWQRPNGTGPFKLQQWQKDQLVVLSHNDNYYGERARLSQVQFKLLSGNPLQLYQSGTIDVSSVGAAYMGLVTDPANPVSKELKTFPELSLFYIGLNASAPPFDDVNVRRAFAYGVDKERVNSLSASNVTAVAYGVLPPGMPGYNKDLQGLRFDAAKAKSLIAASKYGDVSKLPPIVLTTSGWAGAISNVLGGVMEEWRRSLGVEVTVRQLEPEAFLYSLKQEKDDVYDSGWIADYPDPQDFLDILFRTGAQYNIGGYTNPQLDALLDKAAVEQNPDARLKMYQDAEQMVVQDAPIIPLSFGRNYILVKPYVKDYVVNPLGFPLLYKVSVQK